MSRVSNEAAFLLHAIPWSETSLIVELFTRDHGRVSAVAKGARRPRSGWRSVLLQFQPLTVGFSGRNELKTLTAAEWSGGSLGPRGDALLYGFYLNELLMHLLAREDPHTQLWDAYARALEALSAVAPVDVTLRRFEWEMLRETGYAPDLEHDSQGDRIEGERSYRWGPDCGFEPLPGGTQSLAAARAGSLIVSGQTLCDLQTLELESPSSRQQAKYLSRAILSHHLEGATLHTRQLLIDLQKT